MSIHSDYERVHLGEDFYVEVNWADSVKPCKAFRVTIGKENRVVSRDEMFGFLFFFGDEKQQEDLIPVKETKMKSITRMLTLTMKKDMRKGEKLRTLYQYFVPETVYEKLLLSDPKKYAPGSLNETDLGKHVNRLT